MKRTLIKVIIFDLWNTLIPTTIDWVHLYSLIKKNDSHNFETISDFVRLYEKTTHTKEYKSYNDFRKDFFRVFKGDHILLEQELYQIYVNRLDKIHFFSDAQLTLKKLKKDGYKLALLSNTENIAFDLINKKLNLDEYFDYLGLSYKIKEVKPHKKMFLTIAKKFRVKPSECLMVGDSLRSDVTGSIKAGMHSVWINRPKKSFDLAEITPEFEISDLKKIDFVLKKLNKKQVTLKKNKLIKKVTLKKTKIKKTK